MTNPSATLIFSLRVTCKTIKFNFLNAEYFCYDVLASAGLFLNSSFFKNYKQEYYQSVKQF